MGKSYKQNDRHFIKSGKSFSKAKKLPKQNPPPKWKVDVKEDIYEDLKGL